MTEVSHTTRQMNVEVFPAQPHAHELVLIDLSSIAYPIWHMSQADPDANKTSQSVVARVRALANGHPHVAICCDSGRSFRRELAPSYKANRPEHDATLQHQIRLAVEQLASDGFPIWAVKSFEADDLIATATTKALAMPDKSVLIVSADKDLLQLVGPRVHYLRAKDGQRLDAAGVAEKIGVRPDQVRDYLTLVGDSSDNIKGAAGIGPVKACDLLKAYGSIEGIYEALKTHPTLFKPACATALRDFLPRLEVTRALVTLRTDVDLPFEEIARERVVKEAADFAADEFDVDAEDADVDNASTDAATSTGEAPRLPSVDAAPSGPNGGGSAASPSGTGLTVREPDILPAPADYERQLDPRSMRDARILAKDMHDSRLFSAYGTPQGVLSTVMLGRELGLPAMASLRGIHIIEGRHALAAQTMVALILKSGMAEYFEPVEFDAEHAIFETLRKGARKPVRVEHTIAMAMTAGLVKDKSNWVKVPTDMLCARSQSRLARLVYPDIVGGLYTPDELTELREQVA